MASRITGEAVGSPSVNAVSSQVPTIFKVTTLPVTVHTDVVFEV